MHPPRFFLSLIAAATLLVGSASAAEPSSAAQHRATLYQQIVQSALVQRGWRVTQDEPGQVTVQRLRTHGGPTGFVVDDLGSYERLRIRFHADSASHTTAKAYGSLIVTVSNDLDAGRTSYPPLALHNPAVAREFQAALAEADARLTTGHPASALTNTRTSVATNDPARVTIK